jgi:transposase InsO family protein
VFGVPEKILSDQGTEFQSHLISEVLELLDFHRLMTSAHHPETDALTERFNRTIKTMLTNYVNE